MHCTKCGENIGEGASFCEKCGTQVTSLKKLGIPVSSSNPIQQFCVKCGSSQPVNSSFCSKCGNRFQPAPNAAPVQPDHSAQKNAVMPRKWLPVLLALLIGIPLIAGVVVLGVFLLAPKNSVKTIGPAGGTIQTNGIEISIVPNEAKSPVKISLTETKPQNAPGDARTGTYLLQCGGEGNETMTVRMKLNGEATENDLMLCVGCQRHAADGNSTYYHYRYVDAKIAAGFLTATIKPSDYIDAEEADTTAKISGSPLAALAPYAAMAGSSLAAPTSGNVNIIFTSADVYKALSDSGKFLLVVPKENGKPYVTEPDAKSILDCFDDRDKYYHKLGYTYALRDEKDNDLWPFVISIVKGDTTEEGGYTEGRWTGVLGRDPENGTIEFSKDHFINGFAQDQASIRDTIAHELFHFVQANYTVGKRQKTWFDDATATFFGSLYKKGTSDNVNANVLPSFDGVIPKSLVEAGSKEKRMLNARQGYGRAPLIDMLAAVYSTGSNKQQEYDFILRCYEKAAINNMAPETAIVTLSTDEASIAVQYYKYLMMGFEYDALVQSPSNSGGMKKSASLFAGDATYNTRYYLNNLLGLSKIKNKDLAPYGMKLPINALSDADVDTLSMGDVVPAGKATITGIPACGARMLALDFDPGFAKSLPDGATLVLKPSGFPAYTFLISIPQADAKNTEPIKVITADSEGLFHIANIKALLQKKTSYLMGVVCQGTSPISADVIATVEPGAVTLDEIIGSYGNGTLKLIDVHYEEKAHTWLRSIFDKGDQGAGWMLAFFSDTQKKNGKTSSVPFNIVKTGPKAGKIEVGHTAFAFTYANGVLTIKDSINDTVGCEYYSYSGKLYASRGKDKSIVISGGQYSQVFIGFYTDTNKTVRYFPKNSAYLVKSLSGSKPAAKGKP